MHHVFAHIQIKPNLIKWYMHDKCNINIYWLKQSKECNTKTVVQIRNTKNTWCRRYSANITRFAHASSIHIECCCLNSYTTLLPNLRRKCLQTVGHETWNSFYPWYKFWQESIRCLPCYRRKTTGDKIQTVTIYYTLLNYTAHPFICYC